MTERPPMSTTEPAASPSPRTRRAVLAGLLGGMGAWAASAVARISPVDAAAGSSLIIGSTTNNAGTSNTTLTTASSGTALLVTQNGSGTALRGSAVGPGSIAGFFTANNGTGVSGVTGTPNSYGVFGQNNGAAGTAGAIRAAGGNNHGLVATTGSNAKHAIVATNSSGSGPFSAAIQANGGQNHGILASTDHSSGYAVSAVNNGAVGTAIVGTASGGTGVRGGASSGTGVVGVSSSSIGVYGVSSSGTGVFGASTGIGVYGSSSGSWSGYFNGDARVLNDFQAGGNASVGDVANGYLYVYGDLTANGTISANIKSFKIDHPAAPADKYLVHYSTESNEVLNLYSGTVTLDPAGEATVELPTWFGLLNSDVRYQLTPIGSFSPLFIKSEVADGRFTIGGGNAAQKVSWQLTARRSDPYMQAHDAPVEVPKTGTERGTYIHPELYGQPADKRVNWVVHDKTPTS